MDLTIQQLRMLQEVATTGTIALAASNLGYTASAVSQQLAGLERAVGVPVLERVGRNVRLTDAGRELVVHARLVLGQVEEASAAIERLSTDVAGTVVVGRAAVIRVGSAASNRARTSGSLSRTVGR